MNLFGLDAVQVDELSLQRGSVRERGLDARFQTAVNLSVDELLLLVLCVDDE